MFSLFCGSIDFVFSKPEFHIVVLGMDDSGKTTLLERIKGDIGGLTPLPASSIRPTVGVNVGHVSVTHPARCELVITDVGGQDDLRKRLWDAHYFEAHSAVFVIDASAPERRLDDALALLSKLAAHAVSHETPLLILLNKHDVASNLAHVKRKVDRTLARACSEDPDAQRRLTRVQPIAATHGQGVRRAVGWMVELLFKLYY
eukprot:TRINITY_DN5445_c0_g1_i1.p1 TRINITY_DN5445_c0_g1~~TRINITY_DN5445_c0_g1_i1.p1  ORF type:complete len:214 (+),score=27.12 TRINITY_DN5445_c0_g1_i1:37-642(+)